MKTDGYFEDQDYIKFRFNFWLCCYVVSVGFIMLAALIWIPVPQQNESMANLAMGFVTATIIGMPLAYIFGGNAPQSQSKQKTGTATAEISASITTDHEQNNN